MKRSWTYVAFAFPSADPCECPRHRTRNGNSRRCGLKSCTVEMTPLGNPRGRPKLLCLDCFAECYAGEPRRENAGGERATLGAGAWTRGEE